MKMVAILNTCYSDNILYYKQKVESLKCMSESKGQQVENVLRTWGNLEADVVIEDNCGRIKNIPWIITTQYGKFAAWYYDWRKSLGSDRVIRTEKIIENTAINGAILIGNNFSDQAEDIAEELVSSINNKPVFLIKFNRLQDIPVIGMHKLMQKMVIMRSSNKSFNDTFLTEITSIEVQQVNKEREQDIRGHRNIEVYAFISPSPSYFEEIN